MHTPIGGEQQVGAVQVRVEQGVARDRRHVVCQLLPAPFHLHLHCLGARSALESVNGLGHEVKVRRAGRIIGVASVHVLESKREPPAGLEVPQKSGANSDMYEANVASLRSDRT
ncbi:hypothetical protein GEV43_06430 [Actinomadura sp. J1-007]|uniref:hypothetical protein n=1 Tax=Actinomadura sp. J1-007 TaxID=2661913 RepID=UPI00132613B4|nr:hypothetical protein [Actinomadura sp. J1-007]MWK33719.1 hypothetical protein [Actinomadura sp. J1-007]